MRRVTSVSPDWNFLGVNAEKFLRMSSARWPNRQQLYQPPRAGPAQSDDREIYKLATAFGVGHMKLVRPPDPE